MRNLSLVGWLVLGLTPGASAANNMDCPLPEQLLTGVKLRCGEADVIGTLEPSTAPFCDKDGQKKCITSEAFPAVDVATVAAVDVRLETQIGGVTGTYIHEIDSTAVLACIAEGQIECAVTDALSALDTVGLEEKVLAGKILAGTSGIAVLGTPVRCHDGLSQSCLAIPRFPAIQTLRLNQCEVDSQ